jgi:uncharacterized protein involved in response to NO
MGFGWDLPPFYHIWVQGHGHIQLIGWTGLFIIGVSLYFMPRFIKVPLPYPDLTKWILPAIALGLIVKTVALFTIPYIDNGGAVQPLIALVRIGAASEWIGVMLYVFLLVALYRLKPRTYEGLRSVQPFFVLMVIGFSIYSTLHLIQFFLYDVTSRMPWSAFSIDVFIRLVLFPVAFVFTVRTFPLFIQIPPFRTSFFRIGVAYGTGVVLYLTGSLFDIPLSISVFARIFLASIILTLVYHLKIIPKMILSPRRFMVLYYGEKYLNDRIGSGAFTKARPGYYDSGQYGRFELLLFSAYVWLGVYALLEIIIGIFHSTAASLPFGHDPVRHVFLLGFITLLIIGMAQRMVPGFMKKKGLWSRKIVTWTFVLGNVAVFGRVLPILLPPDWFGGVPVVHRSLMYGFGISGLAAIGALLLLLLNLRNTFRL